MRASDEESLRPHGSPIKHGSSSSADEAGMATAGSVQSEGGGSSGDARRKCITDGARRNLVSNALKTMMSDGGSEVVKKKTP